MGSFIERIVNKYLALYDADKLPKSFHLPPYVSANSDTVIKEPVNLEMDISAEQLALLFRLLDEVSVLKYKQKKDMQQFIFYNIKTKTESQSFKYFTNKFTVIDKAAKDYWKDKLAEMQKILSIKLK